MKPIRVKTNWFRKDDGPRASDETATVIASIIWRLADRAVINLSTADYDIITPERGFRILGELIAFMVHQTDRMLFGHMEEATRSEVIQGLGKRMAEIMEKNIHETVGNDGFDYQSNFIDMLNRRAGDYATFEFNPDQPNFQVLRFLGSCLRDLMLERDQPWVIDQIIELEAPAMTEILKKTVDGLLHQE